MSGKRGEYAKPERKYTHLKERLLSPGRVIALLVLFCLFLAAGALGLGFSARFPALRRTLIETFTVSRGTQFLVRTFVPDQGEVDGIMGEGYYGKNLPVGYLPKLYADPSGFAPEAGEELYEIRGGTFVGRAVVIRDPARVRLFTSPYLGEHGLTLSDYHRRFGLLAAMNAGGYLDNDTLLGRGGVSAGPVISGGKIICSWYDRAENVVGFDENNALVCARLTVGEALGAGIRDAVSFCPALVLQGRGQIEHGDGGCGYAPRSAIGQRADGAVIFVVLEGRRLSSIGATLRDVQDVLLALDAYTGCLMDGGSCSTLGFGGRRVSRCVDIFSERPLPNVFGVAGEAEP